MEESGFVLLLEEPVSYRRGLSRRALPRGMSSSEVRMARDDALLEPSHGMFHVRKPALLCGSKAVEKLKAGGMELAPTG